MFQAIPSLSAPHTARQPAEIGSSTSCIGSSISRVKAAEAAACASSKRSGLAQASGARRKSLGQGMTEYIVIVALVGVAAIGVYSFLGQSIRGATSGIALEIAGENADKGIKAAKDAADKAVSSAETKATLKSYNADNH